MHFITNKQKKYKNKRVTCDNDILPFLYKHNITKHEAVIFHSLISPLNTAGNLTILNNYRTSYEK